jgi:anti-sigma B factor antagonist
MSTVTSLSGEHDISTVAPLSETLAALIAGSDSALILDLSAVEFLDASTVGVLVRADLLLGSRALVVRAPSRPALRVLEVCGLSRLLEPRACSDRGP